MLRATLVGVLGLTFGVATAYAQAWLPHEVGSLANSVGSWALLAFLLAFLGATPRAAAFLGFLALVTRSQATCSGHRSGRPLIELAHRVLGTGVAGRRARSSASVPFGSERTTGTSERRGSE